MRRAIAILASVLVLPGCLATKIVTVPVGLAVDAVEATGKGVVSVGGYAIRETGDVLNGPDQRVKLTVTYKKGRGTRTVTREVDSDDIERELNKLEKKGRIVDVAVEPAG